MTPYRVTQVSLYRTQSHQFARGLVKVLSQTLGESPNPANGVTISWLDKARDLAGNQADKMEDNIDKVTDLEKSGQSRNGQDRRRDR